MYLKNVIKKMFFFNSCIKEKHPCWDIYNLDHDLIWKLINNVKIVQKGVKGGYFFQIELI